MAENDFCESKSAKKLLLVIFKERVFETLGLGKLSNPQKILGQEYRRTDSKIWPADDSRPRFSNFPFQTQILTIPDQDFQSFSFKIAILKCQKCVYVFHFGY